MFGIAFNTGLFKIAMEWCQTSMEIKKTESVI